MSSGKCSGHLASKRITFRARRLTFQLVRSTILPQHEFRRGWADAGRIMVSVLEIQDLHVSYWSREGVPRPALAGVSLILLPGEILGVLGESGSGKSPLAAAGVPLLPPHGHIT